MLVMEDVMKILEHDHINAEASVPLAIVHGLVFGGQKQLRAPH